MKIAVVRNRKNRGILHSFGRPSPEKYGKRSVQSVMDALRVRGHTVSVFEGDTSMFSKLRDFISPDPETGRPSGLVFNMSYGIQGDCRYTHVPAMLEMAGIPYTGSSPLGHALCLDKVVTKTLIREAGMPTPNFCTMARPGGLPDGLRFPVVVKPRHESTSYGLRLVRDEAELADAVQVVVTHYEQEALVEDYVDGREIAVGILGNDPVEALPLVELHFGNRDLRMNTHDDKFHKTVQEPGKICPAPVSPGLAQKLRDISLAVFRVCHCKDYARVDIRLDPNGNPFVLEINSMASLGQGGAYVLAAKVAGYTFESLVCRIVDVAHLRYFGESAPRDAVCEAEKSPHSGPLEECGELFAVPQHEVAGDVKTSSIEKSIWT